MEEEEESEESKELEKLIISENKLNKSPKKLAEHLSRYKEITHDMVVKILYVTPKSRTDVQNRIVADYLSTNYDYFKSIKENNQARFLKLIAVLNIEHYLPENIIMDLNFEEDKFFIVFDGLIQISRQYFHTKEMTLGKFTNYLNYIKTKNEKQYNRIIEQNKHIGIDFINIKDNINYDQFEHRSFIFTLEEQEEIGKYGKGYVFGEMNLMRKKKKNLIVKCIQKTEVISVSKFDFNRILKTYEEKRLELLSEKFKKKFDMFKFWSKEQLITLFNYFSKVVFAKDEYIYKQNEPSNYIYFIEKGKFEQYSYTNYFYYKNYIKYIGEVKSNLLHPIIEQKIVNMGSLKGLFREKLKQQQKLDKLIKDNEIDNLTFLNFEPNFFESEKNLEKYKHKDNLYSIKKDEDGLNNPNLMVNIPILTSEMPKIVGIEEPFELKRRFTSVRCISGKLVAQRIRVYDLLKLLFIFNEFKYAQQFLHILIQRKLILIETIKGQMKLNGNKFEKEINSKYNKLISQNEDKNKKFSAIKLKGWNNGIYLDNILDTNLYLFKPKTERYINTEREKRFRIIKSLTEDKPNKNTKKMNKTFHKTFEDNNKESSLLYDKKDYLSHRIKKEKNLKKGLNNIKNYTNTKFHKKKLISFLNDIENLKSKKNNNIMTNINSKIKNIIKDNNINKSKINKFFKNDDVKSEINRNKYINTSDNIFAFTRPLENNKGIKLHGNDYNFKRLMNLLDKETRKKSIIKSHKFDKKAFPAIYSKIEKFEKGGED